MDNESSILRNWSRLVLVWLAAFGGVLFVWFTIGPALWDALAGQGGLFRTPTTAALFVFLAACTLVQPRLTRFVTSVVVTGVVVYVMVETASATGSPAVLGYDLAATALYLLFGACVLGACFFAGRVVVGVVERRRTF